MSQNESATEDTKKSTLITNVTYLSVYPNESTGKAQLDYRNHPDVYRSVVTHHIMALLQQCCSLSPSDFLNSRSGYLLLTRDPQVREYLNANGRQELRALIRECITRFETQSQRIIN